MKRILTQTSLLGTLLAALAISSPVSASTYITLEGTSVSVEDNLDGELNPVGLRFRVGSPIAKNLDVEGHFGFGADTRATAYDEFASTYAGIFVKGYLPIGFNSAFYALGGYSGVNLTQDVNGQSFEDERYGISWGAGFETKISNRVDLTADYTRYVKDEGLFDNISAVSFGLKLYF